MIKLFMIRDDYYWNTRGVWTVCFEYWVMHGNNKITFPKIIQTKRLANEIVTNFKKAHPEGKVYIRDKAVRNENLGY